MTKDMTVGKPMGHILSFAVPLIFGNLFQQMYNMADTIIVGKAIGLDALTAVGATNSVNFLIIGFTLGTCSGLAIPVAQKFGARDYQKMRSFVANAAYLAIAMAAILTLATTLLCGQILRWMNTPSSIYQQAYDYFLIICLGIPFTFLYNTTSGIIRSLGDSKTPFYFLVLSTILNIGLDLLFIIVFNMGVSGAALATILAQGVSGVICFTYMKKKFDILHLEKENRRVDGHLMRILFTNSVPMGLQFSVTAIGSIMMQSAVNGLDVVYVSAFAAATKVKQLAMCPYDAIASACATFGGQNLGAGKVDRIKKGLLQGIFIALVYSVLIGIVLITSGSKIAWLFVDRSEVQVLDAVQQFLTISGFFYWLLAILNCVRMTIQGLGYSAVSILAGLSELAARGLMSIFVIPAMGYLAVCFTDQVAWLAATIIVIVVFTVIIRKLARRHAEPENTEQIQTVEVSEK